MSSVSKMGTLRVGQSGNRIKIPATEARCSIFQAPEPVLAPNKSPMRWAREIYFKGENNRNVKVNTSSFMLTLRMTGAVTPVLHMDSWGVQGQLHVYLRIRINCICTFVVE